MIRRTAPRLSNAPFDRDVLVARERVDPAVVLVGPLAQRLFRDRIRPMNIAEEMHDVLRSREERHVPEDDHAVEAVVYKHHQAAEQLGKGFHRSPPGVFVSATRSSVRRPVETKSADHGSSTDHGTEHPQLTRALSLKSRASA